MVALLENWPSYLVYVISFATIGVMWANHHSIFPLINRASHGLVTANLALLLVVAFIPFPTKVLGETICGKPPSPISARRRSSTTGRSS